jgi:hypothetical protein
LNGKALICESEGSNRGEASAEDAEPEASLFVERIIDSDEPIIGNLLADIGGRMIGWEGSSVAPAIKQQSRKRSGNDGSNLWQPIGGKRSRSLDLQAYGRFLLFYGDEGQPDRYLEIGND